MAANNLTLYAKWGPDTNNVNFYHEKSDISSSDPISTAENQTYQKLIDSDKIPSPGTKEGYEFIGWYYTVIEDGQAVEHAFDPGTMPIDISMTDQTAQTKQPINLYAKWSSNTVKDYKVYYKL